MCGIAAIFAYRDRAEAVRREELDRITAHMFSRGPDAGATWIGPDGRTGLGSRRLAIIDLSDEAAQPMHGEDGLSVVFNGEIYNHRELRRSLEAGGARFRTTSDTEVLLHLYRREGERMTELLRGMFAFVILDARTRTMFVARDPYGIKPLYFADDGGTMRIASQVKALLAGGAVSSVPGLAGRASFLLMGSVLEPFTAIESIRAVEAGTSFIVGDSGTMPARRHYSIAATMHHALEQKSIARLTTPDIAVRELVSESVGYHLVSDVPVGTFLSAGIDSCAIAMHAAPLSREPLQAITIQFDVQRGTERDESAMAASCASSIGAPHSIRLVTREEFLADLPRIFAAMDQPTIDGVNTWFASKAAREAGLKVVLSGLGGDELFGSYPSFRDIPRMVAFAPRVASLPFGEALFRSAATRITKNPKVFFIPSLGRTWGGAYLLKRGLFLPEDLPGLLGDDAARQALTELDLVGRLQALLDPDPASAFGRVATLEASAYMRNQLLRDTDWASMAHSVEVRTPLVDAWLLRQISPVMMEYGVATKQSLAAILPPELRSGRKRGFTTPIAEWLDLTPDGTSTRMRSWAQRVAESVY